MGRHREFDTEETLDIALDLFWAHGYQGTSLADLTKATGVAAPSLYKVFTNKETLFLSAVERYTSKHLGFMDRALEKPTGREVVEYLLRENAKLLASKDHPAGCLGVNGLMACGSDLEPLRMALVEGRQHSEKMLMRRLRTALANGEATSADVSAGDVARYVMTISQGLSVQAKGGATLRQLDRVIDVAMMGLPLR